MHPLEALLEEKNADSYCGRIFSLRIDTLVYRMLMLVSLQPAATNSMCGIYRIWDGFVVVVGRYRGGRK